MKPGSSEFGLVIGIVLFVGIILVLVMLAGDPEPCTTALCGGAR